MSYMLFSFPRRESKGVDLDRRGNKKELRVVGGGETANKIYCMKNLFSIKENTNTRRK